MPVPVNRIFLVGNGFDLANGLKTRYRDFMNGYKISDETKWLIQNNTGLTNTELEEVTKAYKLFGKRPTFIKQSDGSRLLNSGQYREYEDSFFSKICNSSDLWVDIEYEYGRAIIDIVDGINVVFPDHIFNLEKVKDLNIEIDCFQLEFEKYILDNVNKKIQEDNYDYIQIFANPPDSSELREILFQESIPDFHKVHPGSSSIDGKLFTNQCYLNFNYSDSFKHYNYHFSDSGDLLLNIHGTAGSTKNKMNFGFGDEASPDYKLLEDLNDKEYLRHAKSFKYQSNDDYRRFMSFVHSSPFQIVILGHSCGLSDRTLLKSIFEHKNCVSIKVFYYKYRMINDVMGDNYYDLTWNIARHFNDKIAMRNKVVNKTLCGSMPQSDFRTNY